MQNESDLKLKKQKEFLIKFCYFGVIIGTTIIIIKVLGSILTPFLIAFIIAAILNPLIKFYIHIICPCILYNCIFYNNFDWSKTFSTTSKFIYNITTIFYNLF